MLCVLKVASCVHESVTCALCCSEWSGCAGVRAARAPCALRAGGSEHAAHRAAGAACGEAGGVTVRALHGLLGATPLGLASPMGELSFKFFHTITKGNTTDTFHYVSTLLESI